METPATEEIKSYLDRKMRLGKLDSALLFLSSSVGLIFAVTQSIAGPSAGLTVFAPAFLLGWVLPFYYGYVKGGLVRDSITDRYRGWIYFVGGLGMYFLVVVTQPLFEGLAPADIPSPPPPTLFAIPAVMGFVALAGFFFLKAFTRFIFDLVNQKPDDLTLEVAIWTGATAAFIAATGWFITRIQKFTIYSLVFLIPFVLMIAFVWDKSDYYARASYTGVSYKVARRPGLLHGKKGPTFLKDVLRVATTAIWGSATVLIVLHYDLTGFTLLLVEAGALILLPLLVLAYLTRLTRRLEFAVPPRKPRKKALPDFVRMVISQSVKS